MYKVLTGQMKEIDDVREEEVMTKFATNDRKIKNGKPQ